MKYLCYNCKIGRGYKNRKPTVEEKKLYSLLVCTGDTIEEAIKSIEQHIGYKFKEYSFIEITDDDNNKLQVVVQGLIDKGIIKANR